MSWKEKKISDLGPWQKPLHQQKILKSKVTKQKHQQNFDNTTIKDRLRTISLSSYNYQTGVVKPYCEYLTFQITTKAVKITQI